MVRIPGLALVALACAPPLASQQPPDWPGFVSAVERYVAADSIVGAAMVRVRDGAIVNRAVVGMQDRAAGVPVSARTIFHWGSITKTLTAVAILQLRDRGLLSLDDPVTRWVPELRLIHNPFGSSDAITIRMLLSHSAGYRNGTWPWGNGNPWEPFEPTRWEQLVAMMPYQEVLFRPGSRYSYSNPGFIYLARIIEAITGDPWQGYVYKNLFMPLGISHSYFSTTPWHLAGYRSHSYTVVADGAGSSVQDNGADFDPGVTIPNGGWNAPLDDLARWAAFLTGASDPGVLARASLEEMWRPVVALEDGTPDAMGLSFFLKRLGTTRIIGHTGTQAGFRAFLWFNPTTREAVILALNTSSAIPGGRSPAGYAALVEAAAWLLAGGP